MEQSLLYPAQAFFSVLKMSFEGLRVWHCCVLFTFTVSSAHTVEMSRFDLVSVWIFFIREKILSHSALELGMVISALTILDISGNLGVLVILFFISSTSPQKTSVLVPSVLPQYLQQRADVYPCLARSMIEVTNKQFTVYWQDIKRVKN